MLTFDELLFDCKKKKPFFFVIKSLFLNQEKEASLEEQGFLKREKHNIYCA